jgi:hypothetical protein
MFANVPRAITASLPLREPYELNSRGVNLNRTKLLVVLYKALHSLLKKAYSHVLDQMARNHVTDLNTQT